jgi:hypothetical protein
MQIGIITYGESKPIAREVAENILNDMIGETHYPFDYGSTIGKTVSVKGDYGRKIISGCMKATIREFLYNIKNVRKLLDRFSDKELASCEYISRQEDSTNSTGMTRFWMFKSGQYKGDTIYLYDNDGEGIRTREGLNSVLNQWGEPVKGQKVYVTPFDVHY